MSEIGIVLILKQVATREAIKYSYNQLKKLLKTNKTKLSTSSSDFENSIYILANDVLNWSEKLNIIGTDSNKAIEKLYIESKYYLTPQKFQFNKEESKPALLSKVVENETRHCVIFGKPGMGKTTSMKMLTRKILVEENFLVSQFPIPIVIRLRELRETFTDKIIHEFSKVILYQFIAKLFHISIEQKNNEFYTNRDGNLLKNIIALLDNLKPIIIIDGFDEISIEIRDDIFAQIKQIAYKTRNCKIIITSRTGEFAYQLENFSYFEIAKFDDVQIKDYSTSFLGEYIGNKFFEELKLSSYYDISSKPLLLSFLCAIYKHREELPEKPRYIYAEIIDILLNKWDRSRGIVRKSKFDSFGKEEKIEFLTIISFSLIYSSKITFSKFDIIQIYNSSHEKFELDKNDAEVVFSEIEEHSGLFIQSGANTFEFPHKSVQEYLAAKYLLTITNLSELNNLSNIPHVCALMVALSGNPNERLYEILRNVTFEKNQIFVSAFFERMVSENPRFETNFRTAFEISKFFAKGSSSIRAKTYDIAVKLINIKSLSRSYKALSNHFMIRHGRKINYSEISDEEARDFIRLDPIVDNKEWKRMKVHPFKIHKLFLKQWD